LSGNYASIAELVWYFIPFTEVHFIGRLAIDLVGGNSVLTVGA
jgi:hypothetical protein